jgi:branched-chain amino acid aminotransferase
MTPSFLESEVLRTVNKNKLSPICRIRLQLYAGQGGIFEIHHKQPLFIIECYPVEPETQQLNENGLTVGIASGINKSTDTLSNLKTSNALVYAMAASQAKQKLWNDALVLNTSGHIIESAIANVFWVKNNHLFTPPLSEGCVAGVMRRHILATIGSVSEVPLTTQELHAADEVFLTNAIKPIRWVKEIDNTSFQKSYALKLFTDLFS